MPAPDLSFELGLLTSGVRHIAGVDEAGRGPWAGPVYAATALLDREILLDPSALAGVRDSKLLSSKRRDQAFDHIMQAAVAVGVSSVEARLVDRLGVVEATRQAMLQALDSLPIRPDAVIVDAVRLPPESEYHGIHHSFNHADRTCLTVAAASICAKVSRDRNMIKRSARYPGYGFETNMGYGTPRHRAALERLGLCAIHRRSFRPMRESLLNAEKVASVV
ncbi:MAG: ribonuclease HII [Chloroflexi bacterium]|nr:ribonuclease HII [Chloroflexota bacterium]